MKIKLIVALIALFSFCTSVFSQNTKSIEPILPMNDIDQSIDKIYYLPSNMGFMVHVDIGASMKNYDHCSSNDATPHGLKIEIDWYNTNDETGKMVADMIKSDISKIMNSFKNGSGFENKNEVVESDIKGGKMWMYSKQKACVNEITGLTEGFEYFTKIRVFVFTGNKILKLDLSSNSKPETLRKSLDYILGKWENFDYSLL